MGFFEKYFREKETWTGSEKKENPPRCSKDWFLLDGVFWKGRARRSQHLYSWKKIRTHTLPRRSTKKKMLSFVFIKKNARKKPGIFCLFFTCFMLLLISLFFYF